MQIEQSTLQVDVWKSIKKGDSVIKQINAQIKFEEIEKLYEDNKEASEQQEVSVFLVLVA